MDGDFDGKYISISSLTLEERHEMRQDGILFSTPKSCFARSCGLTRDWPDARGIWHNKEKDFLVWVNEREHCQVISYQPSGNLQKAFVRYCEGMKKFEQGIKDQGHEIMWNEHLGNIVTCPHNLGSAMGCTVRMNLPLLSEDKRFEGILSSLGLWKDESVLLGGKPKDGDFDISNSVRLGTTEVQQVQKVVDGIRILTEMEKQCEKDGSITDLLPPNFENTPSMQSGPACSSLKLTASKYKPATVTSSNIPELSKHTNWMAKCLTKEIFDELSTKVTPLGFTFDQFDPDWCR